MLVSLLLDKDYIVDSDIYSLFISAFFNYGNINEDINFFNQLEC